MGCCNSSSLMEVDDTIVQPKKDEKNDEKNEIVEYEESYDEIYSGSSYTYTKSE